MMYFAFSIRVVLIVALVAAAGLLSAPSVVAQSSSDFIVPTRPMPSGRAFHGTAVMGDFLYVFGGRISDQSAEGGERDSTSVLYAPIGADGQLGQWGSTTPLPGPRFYIANSTLVMNDVVYIVGGASQGMGGDRFNTAIWSRPLPNGTLTPWQESAPFGEPLSSHVAVTTPGHLHIIGGQVTGSEISNRVWTNQIYADGSLSQWTEGPALPVPLWFHQTGVAGGRVYVWGGLMVPQAEGINPIPAVLSAPIMSTGRLGPWRREPVNLPQGLYSGSSTVAGNFLMTFVPRGPDTQVSRTAYYSQVMPGGRLTNWASRAANIQNAVYHSVAPDYRRGSIYITGGRTGVRTAGVSQPLTDNVNYFTLSPAARQEAERSWLAAVRAHENTVSAAPAPGERTTVLTYVADRELHEGAIEGFQTVTEARRRADRERIPLIMYFNLRDAPPCIEQNEKIDTPDFKRLTEVAAFAWIDSSEYPQLVQQMAVYRVPTWIFYDAAGQERYRQVGILDHRQIANALVQMRGGG